jgi:hypothetical protein
MQPFDPPRERMHVLFEGIDARGRHSLVMSTRLSLGLQH